MQVSYHTDHDSAYQKLITEVAARPDDIFPLLGTTLGVQQWFPELSVRGGDVITFGHGTEDEEDCEIYKYENPKVLHFEWYGGEIEFLLEKNDDSSKIMLNQRLPLDTEYLSQDFGGWQHHFKSIKSIAEGGKALEMDMDEFEHTKKDIEANLDK